MASREITEDASNWVTQTLDPFHDWQRRPAGFPDATNGSSFIQCVTLTQTTTVNLLPTDVHIFTMPQLGVRKLVQLATESPTYTGDGNFLQYGEVGPVNVVTCSAGQNTLPYYDTGTDTWVNAAVGTDPQFSVKSFDFSPYLVGENRLVSLGFEVHNTTPELLKSGSVVTYRAPQTLTDSQYVFGPAGGYTVEQYKRVIRSVLPPAKAEFALLLSGSQQWEAYDGAYCVCTLAQKENPLFDSNYIDQIYQPTYHKDNTNIQAILLAPERTSQLFPNTETYVQPTPWNTTGAYFSGLQVGSVLNVTVRAYIECFPSNDQLSYLSLTRPSVSYDPVAIELYSRAAFAMKPATKVANNAGGEHWAMVKAVLRDVAPRAAKIIAPVEGLVRVIRKKRAKEGEYEKAIGRLSNRMNSLGMENEKLANETKIFGNDLQVVKPTLKAIADQMKSRGQQARAARVASGRGKSKI